MSDYNAVKSHPSIQCDVLRTSWPFQLAVGRISPRSARRRGDVMLNFLGIFLYTGGDLK